MHTDNDKHNIHDQQHHPNQQLLRGGCWGAVVPLLHTITILIAAKPAGSQPAACHMKTPESTSGKQVFISIYRFEPVVG